MKTNNKKLSKKKGMAVKTKSTVKHTTSYSSKDSMYIAGNRRAFRRTNEWIKFRSKMFMLNNGIDYITRLPLLSNYNVHHIDMSFDNYTDLSDVNRFCVLNEDTHSFIHWLYNMYKLDNTVLVRVNKLITDMYKYSLNLEVEE